MDLTWNGHIWYNTYVAIATKQVFAGNLSPRQYDYLKARLGTNSDVEAATLTSTSLNTLKHWKRSSPGFRDLLQLTRTDRLSAFTALASSLSQAALDALQYLLGSDKGSEKEKGLRVWLEVLRTKSGDDGAESLPQRIVNILNLKGDVPREVLDSVNPQPRLPRAEIVEYVEDNS